MKDQNTSDVGLKYIRLREWILQNIENRVFKYGEKLPSENMLRYKFLVSRQTVRNAISQLETENIVRRVRGSGTYVNKRVEEKPRNSNVGVLLSYLDDYIFPQIMRGIEEVLTQEGYGIDLGITHNRIESEARFIERMLASNPSGIIVEGSRSALPNPNLDLYKRLEEHGIPVLFIHNYYRGLDFPKVLMDDAGCAREMVEMFIKAGHTQIGGIFKSDDIQGHWRYKGYTEALRKNGLPINEEWIKWYTTEDFDSKNILGTDPEFIQYIHPCTGLVCYNDQIAALVLEALNRNELTVPQDLSLVSFDDSVLSRTETMAFTSAIHPKSMMGKEAATRLVKMINKIPQPLHRFSLTFPVHVECRKSIQQLKIE